ncbi:MAG: hypothetical protein ABJK20_18835 [Halieaceae bacterium]
MRLLLISLLLLAQGATAREAMPTEQASRQDASITRSVQEQPVATFKPVDVRAVSSDLNSKLELIVDEQLTEEGRRQKALVSAN